MLSTEVLEHHSTQPLQLLLTSTSTRNPSLNSPQTHTPNPTSQLSPTVLIKPSSPSGLVSSLPTSIRHQHLSPVRRPSITEERNALPTVPVTLMLLLSQARALSLRVRHTSLRLLFLQLFSVVSRLLNGVLASRSFPRLRHPSQELAQQQPTTPTLMLVS